MREVRSSAPPISSSSDGSGTGSVRAATGETPAERSRESVQTVKWRQVAGLPARKERPRAQVRKGVSSKTRSARLSLRRAVVTRYYKSIFVNPILRQIRRNSIGPQLAHVNSAYPSI